LELVAFLKTFKFKDSGYTQCSTKVRSPHLLKTLQRRNRWVRCPLVHLTSTTAAAADDDDDDKEYDDEEEGDEDEDIADDSDEELIP
jgi:hypothetical protein